MEWQQKAEAAAGKASGTRHLAAGMACPVQLVPCEVDKSAPVEVAGVVVVVAFVIAFVVVEDSSDTLLQSLLHNLLLSHPSAACLASGDKVAVRLEQEQLLVHKAQECQGQHGTASASASSASSSAVAGVNCIAKAVVVIVVVVGVVVAADELSASSASDLDEEKR